MIRDSRKKDETLNLKYSLVSAAWGMLLPRLKGLLSNEEMSFVK